MTKHEEILSKMSAEKKLQATLLLIHSTRKLKEASLKQEHPDWPESELKKELNRIFLNAND